MTTAADWSGPVGDAWASQWARTDRSFAGLATHLDTAIRDRAPHGAATIVDIGCGAGATSLAVAEALPDAHVTGIDLSPDLIEAARERGRDEANLTFIVGPVETAVTQLAPVDMFVSRHGVMFFDDPVAALTALRQTAAPGATLIFSCFRRITLNPWATEIVRAITGQPPSPPAGYVPGPFAFADPAFVTDLLTKAGWQTPANAALDFSYRAGAGADPIADALAFFQRIGPAAPILRAADHDLRETMLKRMSEVIGRYATAGAVDFPAAAWLWSAKAPA